MQVFLRLLLLCSLCWGTIVSPLNAEEIPSGLMISTSRLIYTEGQPSVSFWLANRSTQPWVVTASVFKTDTHGEANREKSAQFLVTPPMALLAPGQRLPFRLVWIGSSVANNKTEGLERLRLNLVPGNDVQSQHNTLSISVSLWLKVFVRSMALNEVHGQMERPHFVASCHGESLTIENKEPFWQTVRSVKMGGKELIDEKAPAPMLAPFKKLTLPSATCNSSPVMGILNDNGLVISLPLDKDEAHD